MIDIRTHIQGDFTVDKDSILHGMISGNVLVKNSIRFTVYGMINGNVTIEKNSRTEIRGTIQGNIINSGECQIFGIVNGNLEKVEGQFYIDPMAIIKAE